MKKIIPLSAVLCLLSAGLAFSAAATTTNNLTYAGSLGRFEPSGSVTNLDVTGEAEMTVTLYGSPAKKEALWSRRFSTWVDRGYFSVELTDAAGVDDGTRTVTYVKLTELLAAFRQTDELWVELSDVKVGGVAIAGGAALPLGRISGTPFAICAERASHASGDFEVRGNLSVTRLTTKSASGVSGLTTFDGRTTFLKDITFGGEGLRIDGLLQRPTIANLSTLTARRLEVRGELKAEDVTVTNDVGCVLSSASGATAPRTVRVSDALAAGGTLTVGALSADTLTVKGKFSIQGEGALDWKSGGTLSVPGGVYPAGGTVNSIYGTASYTLAPGAKNSLVALSAPAGETAQITVGSTAWCNLQTEGPQVVTTVLVPLPRNVGGGSTQGAVTVFQKELE